MHHRAFPRLGFFASTILLPTLLCFGCARNVYHVTNLPPEFSAPASLDLDTVNITGLADQSISTEVIQPGDLLEVTMINDFRELKTTSTPVRVADDGSVVVPLLGRIGVSGLEVEQAEQLLNTQSIARGIFRTPCITVTMKQAHTSKVTVVGAVKNPGSHNLPRGSTSLMTAIMSAGGLSKDADTNIEIRHIDSRNLARTAAPPQIDPATGAAIATPVSYQASAPAVTRFNLTTAASGAVKVPDLEDGDVVYVPKRTLPPVHVIGLVKQPGEFEYPPDKELRVLDALALAGGCSNLVSEKVMVIRHPPNAVEPVRIVVSIQAAKNGRDNLVLAPGDTVSVEQTAATAAVEIVQTFIRFSVGGTLSWF